MQSNVHCPGNHVHLTVHLLPIVTHVSTPMDVALKNHQIQSTHGATRHDW